MTFESLLPDASGWQHEALHRRVVEAIAALPTYFRTETFISGIPATDLHTLHGVLGASIEDQLVSTLNAMRGTWDPDGTYALYSFIRQPQTFPDVLLQRPSAADGAAPGDLIIMGIELKGWYLLAAEGEPNFRYQATPAASGVYDLLVVVPWVLAQVISGHPVVLTPAIVGTRLAAEQRNTYWSSRKSRSGTKASTEIRTPQGKITPYNMGRGAINDEAVEDTGGNFGRIARSKVIDDYVTSMKDRLLCGIRLRYWLGFFLALQGKRKTDTSIAKALDDLATEMSSDVVIDKDRGDAVQAVISGLRRLMLPSTPDELE